MYKYSNKNQTSVDIPSRGIFGISPGVHLWDEYQEWVTQGGVTQPWKDEQELLEEARQAKIAEINAAFQAAEQQAVVVGPYQFKGSFESGLAIDAQRRAMVEHAAVNPHAGITTVDFFDITGKLITLPLSSDTEIDALDVCLAIHQSASLNSFKNAQLIAAVKAATTVEAVNEIHW